MSRSIRTILSFTGCLMTASFAAVLIILLFYTAFRIQMFVKGTNKIITAVISCMIMSLNFKFAFECFNAYIYWQQMFETQDNNEFLLTSCSTAFLSLAINLNIRNWIFYLIKIEEVAMKHMKSRNEQYNTKLKVKLLDITSAFFVTLRIVYLGLVLAYKDVLQ